jgi:hypothetical protein
MSIFSKVIITFVLLFPFLTFAKDCEQYKKIIILDQAITDQDIYEIKKEVDSGSLCMRNIFGIMLYKGVNFERDLDRAEAIFKDLADKKIPDAEFNFALAMSKKTDQDPDKVISLIVGIYYKNADIETRSHLSSNARKLGKNYIESLQDLINICSVKNQKCSPEISSLDETKIQNIQLKFDQAMRAVDLEVANKRLKFTQDTKEKLDSIMSIVAVGALIYGVGSAASNYNSSQNFSNKPFFQEQNPWINGNPLHHNLYQWPKPF